MRTDAFDYFLPDDRIATFPTTRRDGSRLMVLGRSAGEPVHAEFAHIGRHLPARSLIVVNDTRVIPARLRGRKPSGGSIELLLTRCTAEDPEHPGEMRWEALGRSLGGAAVGTELAFEGGLVARILRRGEVGFVEVLLRADAGVPVRQVLERVGEIPLPPYIENARKQARASDADAGAETSREAERAFDRERYQTVFAAAAGAVAAPTAGLHFTEELLRTLEAEGHRVVRLTLHVGPGTFRPVKADEIADHQMDAEWYVIPEATARAVNEAHRARSPVVAVGTTVVRALESSSRAHASGVGKVVAGAASSRLFLAPGARFHVVTDLITNFHLPRSTLLMLVSAFAGRERVLAAYAAAVAAGYRFYSYGDAMFIRGSQ